MFLIQIRFSPAFGPSSVNNSWDLDKIVAKEEVCGHNVGFLPPDVPVPPCDGPEVNVLSSLVWVDL